MGYIQICQFEPDTPELQQLILQSAKSETLMSDNGENKPQEEPKAEEVAAAENPPAEEVKAEAPQAEAAPTEEVKAAEPEPVPEPEAKPAEAEEKKAEPVPEVVEKPAAEEKKSEKPESKQATIDPPAEGEEEQVKAKVVEEEVEDLMAIDQFYPEDHIEKEIEDSPISTRNIQFTSALGQNSYKRYNIHFLEDDVIIYVASNRYQTFNLTTHEYKTYAGTDTDGIGSIAVHPNRKYFAVAEKGDKPAIYIREYPSMRLYRVMRKGTEKMYVHTEFSATGEKLVSLGGAPDYTLTVWNWLNQRVILKCKASSQEVFRASFSPYLDMVLCTSGQGHVKFWQMAQTFTGLKLQGDGGKFGQIDLSDVSSFYELPDGKMLSGTEQGTLILWEGVLVKAHLVLEKETKAPVHKGMIEVILYEDKHFITAGADGYIKWWPLADIDGAEGDDCQEVAIRPTKEVSISTPEGEFAHIIHMIKGKGMWLIQDAKGRLWQLDAKDYQATVIREFQSGAITDIALSDTFNMAITTGEDGLVKVWDYLREKPLYQVKYEGRAECIDILRRSDVNKGRICVVGYSTGVVRVLGLGETKLEMANVFKAHDTAVVKVKYCPAQTMLVTASDNGEIFFFEVNGFSDLGKYEPMCLIRLPENPRITDLKWDATSSNILVSGTDGYVYEIPKPQTQQIDNKETYLIEDYPMRKWKIKMMEFQMKKNQSKDPEEEERKRRARLRGELPPEEEEEEEDWDPDAISVVTYMPEDTERFLIASKGQYAGYMYLCKFGEPRPLTQYPLPSKDISVTFLQFSNFGELLIMGLSNGEIRIINMDVPKNYLAIKQHDTHTGSISAALLNFNEQFLLSVGKDGMLFSHAIDKYMIQQESKFEPLAGVEGVDFMPSDQVASLKETKTATFKEENPSNIPEVDAQIDGVDDTQFAVTLRIPDEPEDITDPTIYSIQQSKLRTEEDMRMKLAEEKKDGVRKKIQILREEFTALQEKNTNQEEVLQVHEDDFSIDPKDDDFFSMLSEKNNARIEETKKEVAYNIEYATVSLNKLKDKFYSVLHFEKFTVKALRTHSYVTTFRVPKMSEFLISNLEQFKSLLGAEGGGRESMDFEDEDVMQNMNDGEEERKATEMARKGAMQNNNEAKGEKKTEAEKKREERKIERERRKKEIENLEKQKTNKANQDQNELNKIQEAKNSFGMYMLKRDENYQVPESQQTNFTKKRQQMVLLEASIYKLKMDFNTKIQELKLRKKEILTRVEVLYSRIGAINEDLHTPEELVLPKINEAIEYPQKFFEVNDKDIDEFKVIKADRETKKGAGGGGKMNAKQKKEAEKKEKEALAAKVAADEKKKAAAKAAGETVVEVEVHPYRKMVIERKNRKEQDSQRMQEFDEVRRIELVYEKDQLKGEVNKLIDDFDEEIREMQKEKYRLESDLKNAELKLIVLFEELILLQSMESRDQELMAQLGQCKQQSDMISQSIKDITTDLAKKTKEIDEIREKQDILMTKFHAECPPDHEKYPEVSAFFEKRTKKRRKPEKREKNEDDEDEDEDAEEEEEPEDEDGEDSDGDDEDNLQQLADGDLKIDQIESLHEEKLDLHDAGEKILTHMHQLESKRKKLDTHSRQIKMNMDETMEEIADFQKEKMAKMNELLISVVLKVRQIQNLEEDTKKTAYWYKIKCQEEAERQEKLENDDSIDGEDERMDGMNRTRDGKDEIDYRGFFLPDTCNKSVLFTRNQLLQLIERQRELDIEVDDLQNKAKAAKNMQVKVMKDNRVKDKIVEERNREYQERQMLRFGNLVDLDSLEVSGPSQVVLDLQRKFTKTEQLSIRQVEEEQSRLQQTQRELTQCIQTNTNLLDMIRKMADEQQAKNKQLDNTNKAIFVDEDNEDKRKMQALKQKFKAKLEEQARKIDNIKMEINLYKRKGGHIYTKVTTNRRVNQQRDQ